MAWSVAALNSQTGQGGCPSLIMSCYYPSAVYVLHAPHMQSCLVTQHTRMHTHHTHTLSPRAHTHSPAGLAYIHTHSLPTTNNNNKRLLHPSIHPSHTHSLTHSLFEMIIIKVFAFQPLNSVIQFAALHANAIPKTHITKLYR